ncbi:glycoside hydrolase domain-containing protein [Erysipelothrix anatis]|uniref:glycoside hydrolase domain-containing protein n=1 Tax=Erysipelothrix anatis TaxID=2683713 RepID=UPI00140AD419
MFALLANGYEVNINSYWSIETSDVIKEFQSDMAIPVIGKVNFTTWMALLISYGDKNRAYNACDTRFEITESRLNKLKSMGITAVGRYINGTDFKVLRADEPARIIDGGLKLIPIYQENGTSSSDFSFEEGVRQAQNARHKLKEFRIPRESTVFFAVDYDAQDWEITSYILPYFRGITSSIGNYNVGVYGTRNLCTK